MTSIPSCNRRSALAALLLAVVAPAAPVALASDQDATKPAAPPAEPAKPAAAAKEFVLMSTSKGDIILELKRDKAPISVANFLEYVDAEFYDGTIFHRVIPNFMIQGGGFTGDLKQKAARPPIRNEWTNGLRNERGTIAMARLPQPDTATSQFFINVRDNATLDGDVATGSPGYAVFGRVVDGLDVVDAIKSVRTSRAGVHEALPVEPVVIVKVARLSEDDAKKRIEESKAAKAAAAAEAASGESKGDQKADPQPK